MTPDASLTFDQLTVTFGGLTAVNDFSFAVEEGKIYSIIGPNGAGKTTAFNAATGIYHPTTGRVLVLGHEPSRPFTWKVVAVALVLGLLSGLAMFVLSHNIDSLWRAAIKRNMAEPHREFSYGDALLDGLAYLRGELALEFRRGTWRVVSADGISELRRVPVVNGATPEEDQANTEAAREQAEAIRENYEELLQLEGSRATLEESDGKWRIKSPRDERTLAEFSSNDQAVRELEKTARLAATRRTDNIVAWTMGLLGVLVGGLGVLSLWQQSRRTPDVITRGGLARTFQNIRLFHDMTALENVLVGMERRLDTGLFGMMLGLPSVRRVEDRACARGQELLAWVGLAEQRNELARNLPPGAQRRLEIARALATKPEILMLDEPAAGINPTEADDLMHLVREIKEMGITVVLIEHHMKFVMNISDRIAVLDHGVKIAEGTPEEIRNNPEVIEAYLGTEELG